MDQAPLPSLRQAGVSSPIKSQTSFIHLVNRKDHWLLLHLSRTFAILRRSLTLPVQLLQHQADCAISFVTCVSQS